MVNSQFKTHWTCVDEWHRAWLKKDTTCKATTCSAGSGVEWDCANTFFYFFYFLDQFSNLRFIWKWKRTRIGRWFAFRFMFLKNEFFFCICFGAKWENDFLIRVDGHQLGWHYLLKCIGWGVTSNTRDAWDSPSDRGGLFCRASLQHKIVNLGHANAKKEIIFE